MLFGSTSFLVADMSGKVCIWTQTPSYNEYCLNNVRSCYLLYVVVILSNTEYIGLWVISRPQLRLEMFHGIAEVTHKTGLDR